MFNVFGSPFCETLAHGDAAAKSWVHRPSQYCIFKRFSFFLVAYVKGQRGEEVAWPLPPTEYVFRGIGTGGIAPWTTANGMMNYSKNC